MYVRIVTFSLNGPTDEQYRNRAAAIADMFNAWPGLQAKLWLADEAENRYGGIYLFVNQAAAQASRSTPLFGEVIADTSFADRGSTSSRSSTPRRRSPHAASCGRAPSRRDDWGSHPRKLTTDRTIQ